MSDLSFNTCITEGNTDRNFSLCRIWDFLTVGFAIFKSVWYDQQVMKKKLTRKIYQYTAVFEPDEKFGGFTVTIPALPGCISEGNTFEISLKNIKEAASLYIEVMQNKNFDIPREEKGVVIVPVEVMV